ncbi:oxygenase MpaB family protein [Planotetraspora sp. GP83]|uniref:oxygenase MpaB family protein n=1 Tax=Planotetraspora sp. GP83 TaxID=3156264 RepID=UPI003511E84F
MTLTHQRDRLPGRVVNFDAVRAVHGEKADDMVKKLDVGDPLADAVIAELDRLGKEGRKILNAGLADGLGSLENPPPAIAALLRQLETVPRWADQEMLKRGEVMFLSINPVSAALAGVGSALVHTYASPAIAKLLVRTGQLTTMAPRRLVETGMWARESTLPGGLLRGAPGYIATAQVRLLHARVRATALKHGWDTAEWGVPINQIDIARTWLDFTLVPFKAHETLGVLLTEAEQNKLYRYWWHTAHLLGLEEEFFLGVETHADAQRLQDLTDSTIAPPDENSRALTEAMLDAQAEALSEPLGIPKATLRQLFDSLVRRFFGDEMADALHLPVSDITPLLPLITILNGEARRWQTRTPETAAAALEEFVAAAQAQAVTVPEGPEYEQHMNTGQAPAPAA